MHFTVKTLPFGLQQAKERIYSTLTSQEEKDETYLKLLKNSIKLDTGANMLHIEAMTVHFMDERIDYLCKILENCPNNTLVLATHVEYIKYVAEKIAYFKQMPVEKIAKITYENAMRIFEI